MDAALSIPTVLALAFGIGCVCGLRSMMGPALVCWGAHLAWLNLVGSRLVFLRMAICVVIFTLFAIGELVADKLPGIPGRNTAVSLIVRFLSGGFCGLVLAIAGHAPNAVAFLLGGLGGLIGGLGGYYVRRNIKRAFKLPDFPVALTEDLIAIGTGLFIVSRF
jgi:uncharacterized membrane protein